LRCLVNPLDTDLSIADQCRLLNLGRSSYYYEPVGESAENLALMLAIDKLHMNRPYFGVERIKQHLEPPFTDVNVKRIRRLMRLMDINTLFAPLNASKTSEANKEHEKYPYLLRGVKITHPRQVYSTDITYVPMKDGFMYLCAVIDWYSRFELSWTLSNTLTSDFCIEALEIALSKWGKPEIFNTDQGSQFTSKNFTQVLKDSEIKISMDGKGRALDNVFIERFWRTVKYEDIYLKAYENGAQLYKGLDKFFQFYNYERKHQALNWQTPHQIFEQEQKA
jgi:putative transposase